MGKLKIDKKSTIVGVLIGILTIGAVDSVPHYYNNALKFAKDNPIFSSLVSAENSKITIGKKKGFEELNKDYESPVAKVAKEVGPAVVGIKVKVKVPVSVSSFDPFGDNNSDDPFGDFFNDNSFGNESSGKTVEKETEASGSGIIFNKEGYIVTNNHVITADTDKVADNIEVILHDDNRKQKTYKAKVIGRDPQTDLAVIKIDDAENLTVAEFGDSSKVKLGDTAIAIGNPLGEDFAGSVTTGVISNLNRKIQMDDKEMNLIQTDAAINGGNSGGALTDIHGEVIGINSVKLVSEGVEGMGFAIPINQAKTIIKSLVTEGKVTRPELGIYIDQNINISDEQREEFGIAKGVVVGNVVKGSGADLAGIKKHDVITSIDGDKVETIVELREKLAKYKVNDKIKLGIWRKGIKSVVEVKLVSFHENKNK